MGPKDKKIILISGASSGIGKATANCLAGQGHMVYGTSRFALIAPNPLWHTLTMDVCSDQSVVQAVNRIIENEGRLDVVINNAGIGISGAVEDTSIEEARAVMETNFFGTMRVCKAVLPVLRRQKAGYIINISSIGGLIGLPYQGLYSASKFALEGMTEALSKEVKDQGIKVLLIEPGDCCTGFTANRKFVQKIKHNSDYNDKFVRAVRKIERDENNGYSPDKIACLISRIINNPHPRLRYAAGYQYQKFAVPLKNLIPARLLEDLIIRYYN